ncbi:MAG: SDR family NAD(P)-dependent oxidoreductase [Planctomycetota bacterium]
MRIIVTGASRGIGQGIARVLAAAGHRVGLVARSESLLRELQDELRSAGHDHVAYAAVDLCDAKETERECVRLSQELGGIDALVNNAGRVIRRSIVEISLEEWQAVMRTNIDGVFHATRALLPQLRAQRSGHIINVSSISGRVPLPGGSAYAASKYAVTGLSESMFHELRDDGIKVSVVFPGSVATESRPTSDDSWKVTPQQVGETCLHLLQTAPENCVHSVEIRPLKRPPRS